MLAPNFSYNNSRLCQLAIFVLICVVSTIDQCVHDYEEDDGSEIATLNFELLQRSISIVSAPEAAFSERSDVDSHNIEELEKDVAATRARLAFLEDQLLAARMIGSTPRQKSHGSSIDKLVSKGSSENVVVDDFKAPDPVSTDRKLFVLAVVLIAVALQMVLKVITYRGRHCKEDDVPWYHDSRTMKHTIVSACLIWFMTGIIVLTELITFTGDNRHLTLIESFYVTAQIITTVGYGDLSPSTNQGKVFLVFYAITGVTLVATILQEIIFEYIIEPEQKSLNENARCFGRFHQLCESLIPVLLCVSIGTIFFWCYAEEQKSFFEAFYLSVFTLLTIGFDAYPPRSPLGQLFATIWMLLGVVFVGQLIVTFSNTFFQHRKELRSKAAVKQMFDQLKTTDDGFVDAVTFLQFDLVSLGVPMETITDSLDKFAKYNRDRRGTLEFTQFEEIMRKQTSRCNFEEEDASLAFAD